MKPMTSLHLLVIPLVTLFAAQGCQEPVESRDTPVKVGFAVAAKRSLLEARAIPDAAYGIGGLGKETFDINLGFEKGTLSQEALKAYPKISHKIAGGGGAEHYDGRKELIEIAQKGELNKIPIFVHFDDLPFAWEELRNPDTTQEDRDWVVSVRKEQVAERTKEHSEQLAAMGAENVGFLWLSPIVYAEVPADLIPTIIKWQDVKDVNFAGQKIAWEASAYTGKRMRSETLIQNLRDAGFVGNNGGRAGGAIRAALHDSRDLYPNHPNFKLPSSSFSRLLTYACPDSGSCISSTLPLPPTTGAITWSHGSDVAYLLAGTIESGQHPSYPGTGTNDQADRSGVMSTPTIYYYTNTATAASPGATVINALAHAVQNGADTFEMSGHLGECPGSNCCNPTYDPIGFSTAVKNAAGAGTLTVKSLGNKNDNSSCQATYPATRKELLAVAALDSVDSKTYHQLSIANPSSRGGMGVTVLNGSGGVTGGTFAVADIAAPGALLYFPGAANDPDGYHLWPTCANDTCAGFTSYATPIAAGAAGLLRSAWVGGSGGTYFRGTISHGFSLLTNMLLMGDAWSWQSNNETNSGFDIRSGSGRMTMHYPDSVDLGANWSWSSSSTILGAGGFAQYHPFGTNVPAPASITQIKVAMTFVDSDYSNLADIDLVLEDTCPAGGGGTVVIASDTQRDIRARLQASNVAGKCLRVRAYTYAIPSGQTRDVYLASYAHSSNVADH